MTVWRPGMLAVCVDDSPAATSAPITPLVLRKVYRFREVRWCVNRATGMSGYGLYISDENFRYGGGWDADRFRPLNDDLPRAELIARIKQCKPQSLPVTIQPVPDHADQDSSLRVGMQLSHTGAAVSGASAASPVPSHTFGTGGNIQQEAR